MSYLAVIISDQALLSGIMEQWSSAELGETQVVSDIPQAYRDDACTALLIDEAALDKKIAKTLFENREALTKPVLLLGQVPSGCEAGFTEVIAKPFRLGQALARLRYYVETVPRLRSRVFHFGGLRFEVQNRQIVQETTHVVMRLTEKETALLAFLAQSDKPVSREELLAAVWGYDSGIDTHTLETHIYQLRRKLDADGKSARLLVNENGAYRLER